MWCKLPELAISLAMLRRMTHDRSNAGLAEVVLLLLIGSRRGSTAPDDRSGSAKRLGVSRRRLVGCEALLRLR